MATDILSKACSCADQLKTHSHTTIWKNLKVETLCLLISVFFKSVSHTCAVSIFVITVFVVYTSVNKISSSCTLVKQIYDFSLQNIFALCVCACIGECVRACVRIWS